jgi:hypothetical protein
MTNTHAKYKNKGEKVIEAAIKAVLSLQCFTPYPLSESNSGLRKKMRLIIKQTQHSLTAEKALAMELRTAMLAGKTKKSLSGSNPFIILSADSTAQSPSMISWYAR